MNLTIDIPKETLCDLKRLADFHAVPLEDVARHYVIEGVEAERLQRLGPWDRAFSRSEAKRPLPPDVLANALQDNIHRDVGRSRVARVARRLK